MSIFSDYQCGAMSDDEFRSACARMNAQDLEERERLEREGEEQEGHAMTRADAIDYLTALWRSDYTNLDETIALEMAIEALKQQSAIEDIKHEIRKYLEDVCIYENEAEGIMFCLDIIDKHISGKENV